MLVLAAALGSARGEGRCLALGDTRTFHAPAAPRAAAVHCLAPLSPGACFEVRVSLPAWAALGTSVTLLDGGGRNISHAEGDEKLQYCVPPAAGGGGAAPSAVALTFSPRGPPPLAAAGAAPYDVRVDALHWGVLPNVALRLAAPLALAGAATAAAVAVAARSGGGAAAARQRRE
jgi:hypothetical protein